MKPRTILIVDDVPLNLKLLQSQLEAEGYVALTASNGLEALELLEREAIDTIISDILMPGMDGYRLCYEVRSSERYQQIPFIFHTATYTSPADEKLCFDLGADKYLRKPASVRALLQAISETEDSQRRQPTATLSGNEVLREYSERLVSKLEQKNIELMAAASERDRAEDELHHTHAQLRQLLEHSPAVIYALDLEGENVRPRLVSENVTRLLGYAVPETLSYEWWLASLHPEDRDAATASMKETITRGETRTEYRVRHQDGSYKWVSDNRRLVRDAQGRAAELVGVWADITDYRRAQDELRLSEQRFGDMLRNLQLIAMMLDRDARITYCNDYLLQLTGWRREELLGRDWFEVFVPSELDTDLKGVFSELLAEAPGSGHHENEILTRSGTKRLVRWNNSVLRSSAGDVVGTACIGEDITDRRSLENQLLRAERMESLGTLAGGIAHDLNNLFMPILMGVTLIKRYEPSDRTQSAIQIIERCVQRGTDLVKQVLLFARGGESAKVVVDLAIVIAEVEAITRSTFPKNVSFRTAITGSLPQLVGDPTQLAQVLLNLCVNARDAMPRGGTITVSAGNTEISEQDATLHGGSLAGPYVALAVADNGTGIEQSVIDRIFEPFFTTKPVGLGTGLGLSTAQGIVRSHGGFLTVSSEAGKGSVFTVYLPTDSGGAAAIPVSQTTVEDVTEGKGELILVVDDEATVRDITRQTLEFSGYKVLTAEDGAQAMEKYVHQRADIALVVTDMMMPVLDGATLIAALRRINPEVLIIAMSGDATQAEQALKAGTSHFLSKPFTAEVLLSTVFEVLRVGGKVSIV